MDGYGQIDIHKTFQYDSWRKYLDFLIARAEKAVIKFNMRINMDTVKRFFLNNYKYIRKPRFLLLDPNVKNFLFNKSDNIIGIIDIDHPIAFDPMYELAAYSYYRDDIFKDLIRRKLIKNNMLEIIYNYGIIFALNDILFRLETDETITCNDIEFYTAKVINFYINRWESHKDTK
jgi:hypothetical protein